MAFKFNPLTGQLDLVNTASSGSSPLTTKGDIYTFTTVNARLGVGSDGTILIADSSQTTGLRWGSVSGSGTVTSVSASGGTTGLTLTGGPITTSGTLTLGGTLAIANGGTGSATQNFVDLTTAQTVGGVKNFTTPVMATSETINGAVGTARSTFYDTSGSKRWEIQVGTGAESGSNAGSDWGINTYDDTGAYLNTPWNITRSSGFTNIFLGVGVSGGATTDTLKVNTSQTFTDAANVILGTTTGTKIGTATTQKLGFFNTTPVVQQAAATDLGTAISNLGLRVAGGSYAIGTSGSINTSGTFTAQKSVVFTPTTITTATTLTVTSSMNEICNPTAAITVTLPATTTAGIEFLIKNISTFAVTVAGTVDGATNYALASQYKYVRLVSSGTSGVWYVIGNN